MRPLAGGAGFATHHGGMLCLGTSALAVSARPSTSLERSFITAQKLGHMSVHAFSNYSRAPAPLSSGAAAASAPGAAPASLAAGPADSSEPGSRPRQRACASMPG